MTLDADKFFGDQFANRPCFFCSSGNGWNCGTPIVTHVLDTEELKVTNKARIFLPITCKRCGLTFLFDLSAFVSDQPHEAVRTYCDADQPHAHRDFQCWRRDHRAGFVVNCREYEPWMLHGATGCHHMGGTGWQSEDTDEGDSLTKLRKACSVERDELEKWARMQFQKLVPCAHCKAAGVL